MPFWTYMLHCADRTFYVGHTDDLETRVGQHELGLVRGYTSMRRPVKLVWSECFPTREEAREAERQLKGWGRDKKLALIRGDWNLISDLAKGKKGPSTSSGKPVSVFLHPHLAHLPSEPFALEVKVRRSADLLRLSFRLTGALEIVQVPSKTSSRRRDELWLHTCFEAFVKTPAGPHYDEFNLAPSTEWAAYGFHSHRQGMEPLSIPDPQINAELQPFELELKASVPASEGILNLNLAAVIEEKSGAKSYWALAHPPEGPPDFHHPACFVLDLPPPSTP